MYGLKEEHIEQIKSVFSGYEFIDSCILYGSRAKGDFRYNSDIDISVVGNNIDINLLLSIENKLDDLLLPYEIDLSIFHKIENIDLVEHITRVGVIFYKKQQ